MMRRLFCLFSTTLLAAVPAASQTASRAQLAQRIDSIAETALHDGPTAALSVAVVRDGETIVERGYGFADIENDVPATKLTVYRIGSLTKQFTAAGIMRLVEQGRIDLHADITQYVPDYPTQGHRVTIEQLLTHTSGIKSYTGLGEKFWGQMRLDLSHEDMFDLFANEPFDFAPGEKYLYNNSGYYLLGVVIENVTEQSYPDYVREQFFEPLGMANSHYCTNRAIVKHRAEGYVRDSTGLVNDEYLSMRLPYAAGSLCSDVVDLVTWTQALHHGEVVSDVSYGRMTTPAVLSGGDTTSYGYGLGIGDFEGHRVIQHAGGINGFKTFLAHYPEDDLTVVVLANTEGANPGGIVRDVARVVLGLEAPRVLDLALTPLDQARYAGVYQLGAITLEVFAAEEGLSMKVTGQPASRILYQGDHRFVVADDDEIELLFTVPDGGVAASVSVHQGGQEVASGSRASS